MKVVLKVYKNSQHPLTQRCTWMKPVYSSEEDIQPPIAAESGKTERYDIAYEHNQHTKLVDWRFTTEDARTKLKRLYLNLSH